MMKINENTSVPLSWFVSAMIFMIGITITGSYWVFGVNRGIKEIHYVRSDVKAIKQFLKIPENPESDDEAQSNNDLLIETANAKEKR